MCISGVSIPTYDGFGLYRAAVLKLVVRFVNNLKIKTDFFEIITGFCVAT